jgi:hypothetical protein
MINQHAAVCALVLLVCGTVTTSFTLLSQPQQLSSTTTLQPSTHVLFAKKKVFIDGEAGTTGIQVRDRLATRDDLEIISAPTELRKDEATRKKLINEADAVILCKFYISKIN